jgi:[1-hydroxy-2-(trimethylamino)ethyl]phosphonate dioxygenase
MNHDPVAVIVALIEGRGEGRCGLSVVNQREHAPQAALLAEQSGCDSALVTAALVHDIGHMVHDLGDDPAADGVDDRHEQIGHDFLRAYFGSEVTEPVRLHVAAKQYLCATEADYYRRLSSNSVRSLTLQGGPMSKLLQHCRNPARRCNCAASTRRPRSGSLPCRRCDIFCHICGVASVAARSIDKPLLRPGRSRSARTPEIVPATPRSRLADVASPGCAPATSSPAVRKRLHPPAGRLPAPAPGPARSLPPR